MNRTISVLLLAGLFGLGGCDRDMNDLESYVAEVTSRQSNDIEPAPEINPYVGFTYDPAGRRDPFQPPAGLAAATTDKKAPEVSNKPRTIGDLEATDEVPDRDRQRGPLESMPLDSLRIVGIVQWNERPWVLVRSSEPYVHRLTVGDFMGQNYGKITSITNNEIKLRELLPDGFGAWRIRRANILVNQEKR